MVDWADGEPLPPFPKHMEMLDETFVKIDLYFLAWKQESFSGCQKWRYFINPQPWAEWKPRGPQR